MAEVFGFEVTVVGTTWVRVVIYAGYIGWCTGGSVSGRRSICAANTIR
jgi:hypothetical protein